MAKIFYSLSGEGRGHATRVRAIVEELRKEHEVSIFAPDDAYALLSPAFANTEAPVYRIPGLAFHYDASRRLDIVKTLFMAGRYLLQFPWLVRRLESVVRREQPDLVIISIRRTCRDSSPIR